MAVAVTVRRKIDGRQASSWQEGSDQGNSCRVLVSTLSSPEERAASLFETAVRYFGCLYCGALFGVRMPCLSINQLLVCWGLQRSPPHLSVRSPSGGCAVSCSNKSQLRSQLWCTLVSWQAAETRVVRLWSHDKSQLSHSMEQRGTCQGVRI